MRISAENVLHGQVVEVTEGAVNGLVKLDVNGDSITADISVQAIEELGLKPGMEAVAIIKATDVMLSPEKRLQLSARNQIFGHVKSIENGTINGIVMIEADNGLTVTAGMSWRSLQELGLKQGMEVTAVIKASAVMLGLEN